MVPKGLKHLSSPPGHDDDTAETPKVSGTAVTRMCQDLFHGKGIPKKMEKPQIWHFSEGFPRAHIQTFQTHHSDLASGAIQGMEPRMVCLKAKPWIATANGKTTHKTTQKGATGARHVKVSSVRLEQPKSASFTMSPLKLIEPQQFRFSEELPDFGLIDVHILQFSAGIGKTMNNLIAPLPSSLDF